LGRFEPWLKSWPPSYSQDLEGSASPVFEGPYLQLEGPDRMSYEQMASKNCLESLFVCLFLSFFIVLGCPYPAHTSYIHSIEKLIIDSKRHVSSERHGIAGSDILPVYKW
jgi:hypothetical protein